MCSKGAQQLPAPSPQRPAVIADQGEDFESVWKGKEGKGKRKQSEPASAGASRIRATPKKEKAAQKKKKKKKMQTKESKPSPASDAEDGSASSHSAKINKSRILKRKITLFHLPCCLLASVFATS